MTLDGLDLFLRVLLAAGLGAAIGLEREISDQPAGFRTHILVSLGAALFTMAGAYAFVGQQSSPVDPTRVAAQVVTGIGFLGAGAIIQQGVNVRGLTTAASLWVTAAIGLAVGLGYIGGALATTGVALAALVALKPLERGLLRRLSIRRHRLIVEPGEDFSMKRLIQRLQGMGIEVGSFNLVRPESDEHHYVISVRLPRKTEPDRTIADVLEIDGVKGAAWYG